MRPRSTPGALVALACASFVLGSWTSHVVAAEPVVEITASLSKTRAAPGDTVEVRFHIAVPDGLHLYPPGTNAGLPISAKLAPDVPGLSPGDLDAGSAAKTVEIPKIGPTPVLEGTFDVVWPLRIGPEASAGHFDLKGTFTYQACKAASCYRPKEVPFAVALEVEEVPSFGPPAELPPPRPVRVSFKVSPAAAKQGDAVVLSMEMFVAKGYHTYPPGETSGDPVKVNVVPPPGISLEGPLRAPPGHEAVFFGEKCRVYEGTVQFEQTLRIAPDFKPGEAKLAASTTWQVCDDKQCFQDHGNGEVTLTVAARTASDPVATPPVTTATANAAPTIGKQGLILTAIGAGIANLLMPCTFPMIPITISIFSKGKKLSRGKTAWRAGVYAAGIILSFTVMGGVVQAVFGTQGQQFINRIATNGPLNIAITAAFVYFALSFFGYYEIELPAFLKTFVDRSVSRAQGAPGGEGGVPTIALFLMGLFFVLTSYTCGAPIILGLFAVGAASGNVIAATAIFGATTAFPFFVLALVPGVAKSLPKGGGWFHSLKVVLGTLELAAALKFLSNADIYWRWGLLTKPVFLALWVLAAAFMFAYVAGILRFAHDEAHDPEAPRFSKKAFLASIPFLALTIYLANGLNEGAKLQSAIDAFLPPDPYPGRESSGKKEQGLPPAASYKEALEKATKAGKPLLLEFTGHV